ncbi:hypothetical protein HPB50_016632 [Hyalomma asiaticum]|uniref:Uncharacterized protein n=1 Tax=Hyalomma asiaticum TaxID=266040 RepID=A0ACB7RJP6_HYAAI|nr:hypothetical protein HPB50_016632 [Hyalomma asiaticum]
MNIALGKVSSARDSREMLDLLLAQFIEIDRVSLRRRKRNRLRTPATEPSVMFEPPFDPPLPPFRCVGVEIWLTQFDAALECNSIWIEELNFEVLKHILPPDLQCHQRFKWWSPSPYVDMRKAVLNYFGAPYFPRPPTPTHSTSGFQLFSTPTSCSRQSTSHDTDSPPETMSLTFHRVCKPE